MPEMPLLCFIGSCVMCLIAGFCLCAIWLAEKNAFRTPKIKWPKPVEKDEKYPFDEHHIYHNKN